MFAVFAWAVPFMPSPEVLNSCWYLVFFLEFMVREVSLHSMRVCDC